MSVGQTAAARLREPIAPMYPDVPSQEEALRFATGIATVLSACAHDPDFDELPRADIAHCIDGLEWFLRVALREIDAMPCQGNA